MDRDIKKILIVGAGVMGHGIAQTFAQAGYQVSLVDVIQKTLDRALGLIKSSLGTFTQEGLLAQSEIPEIIGRITLTTSLEEGAREADIAIEAVTENRELKKEIFAQLDKYCPRRALLASNTTALNIFDFVETSRPEKVLICHWYTPPQIIPLVDVIKGPRTSKESVKLMVRVLKKIGKKPLVMSKFISGYIVPRLQMALQREIHFLLDNEYATPQELDEAVKCGLALRMMVVGVVQRFDFGGLDLTVRNLENPYVQSQLTPLDYKPKTIFELFKQGHLGVKTGKGFYDYKGRSEAEIYRERDINLIRLLKAYKSLGKKEQ